MRSRPSVELRMPLRVYPGSELRVELKLIGGARTPIEFVRLHFEGTETTRPQPGPEAAPEVVELFHRVVNLAGKSELEAETYQYEARFTVPLNAPITYLGTLVEYRYWVKVHVAIPWWLDVEDSYEAVVEPRRLDRPPPQPYAGTSLKGSGPFVEVSLADQRYAPGDVIEGSVAFGNIGGRTVRGLDLSLVGYEKVASEPFAHSPPSTRPQERLRKPRPRPSTGQRFAVLEPAEAHRFTAAKPIDSASEGREVPFRFGIPTTAPLSFETPRALLFWVFEVRLDLRSGPAVVHRTPLTLARFDRPAERGSARRKVGAGRWHAVWGDVGKQAGLTLDPSELELSGVIDRCDVSIRIGDARAGREGLVGSLRFPSFGLGLSIQNRGLLDFGIDLADQDFDERFRVRGRDEAQTRNALRPRLRRALLRFDEVTLDDERATVLSRTPGHDQPWIGRFVAQVAALARQIAEAQEDLPPPPPMAELLPAFRRFAQDLGGRLEVGTMSIFDARFEGGRFAITTDFGRGALPERTSITLSLDPPLPRPFDLEGLHKGAAARGARPDARHRGAREFVAHLRRIARGIRVTEQEIAIELGAPLDDFTLAREAMGTMVALAEAARGERRIGPYR